MQEHESSLVLRESQLNEQQQTITELQRLNENLAHRLDKVLRRIYNPSSERIDPKQLLLFGLQMQQAAEKVEKLAECQEKSSGKRKGHGRRRLPDNLPRHLIEHGIDPFIYLRDVLANIGSTPQS